MVGPARVLTELSERDEADHEMWRAAALSITASTDKLPGMLRELGVGGGGKDGHERLNSSLLWRHSCFLDATLADWQLSAAATAHSLPLSPGLRQLRQLEEGKPGLQMATAMQFVQDLLVAALPLVELPLAIPKGLVQTAIRAFEAASSLAAAVPVGLSASEGSRKLLEYLVRLTNQLRRMDDGAPGSAILVPVGWLNSSTGAPVPGGSTAAAASSSERSAHGAGNRPAAVLLALRCVGGGRWDLAVCSACAGLGYHPSHAGVAGDDQHEAQLHDPVILVRDVSSERLFDTAPWLLLYRELAFRSSSTLGGARTLYEVVLPFLSERSLPESIARDPPPTAFRRVGCAVGDQTRTATAFEGLRGLLLLGGCPPSAACALALRLRRLLLEGCGMELESLRELPDFAMGQSDHALIQAACRGVAAHAAEASVLPYDGHGDAPQPAEFAVATPGSVRDLSEAGMGHSATVEELQPVAMHADASSGTSDAELRFVAHSASCVGALADQLHARGLGDALPPTVRLPVPADCSRNSLHGLFSRLRRLEDVKQFAGKSPEPPFLRPVQLTHVAEEVGTVHEVSLAMQHALQQCTLLSNQSTAIKNSGCIRVALLQHIFTGVIPLPLPLTHPDRASRCFWHSASVSFQEQAAMIRLAGLLAQHYAAASLCLTLTHEHDGARIVTVACMAALVDALLRVQASDLPSTISRHYAGCAGGLSAPFGFDAEQFAEESQSLKLTNPALAVARAMLLNYFASVRQTVDEAHRVFAWERTSSFSAGEIELVGRVCVEMGFEGESREAYARYLTGETPELIQLCPELGTFRDVVFLLKLFMCPTQDCLPGRKHWRLPDARLQWHHSDKGVLHIQGFSKELRENLLKARGERPGGFFAGLVGGGNKGSKARVPPSGALPSVLLGHIGRREDLTTEEAILFLKSEDLRDFQRLDIEGEDRPSPRADGEVGSSSPDGFSSSHGTHGAHVLSSRDAELLLQYLTAPYLRIPLLLAFFADPVRIQALSQPRLQDLLEACLFEPGPWQEAPERPPPDVFPVPRERRAELLSTPLGLLFNELLHAPSSLLLPHLNRMLAAALDMDTGTPTGASASIIFFVVRLAVRIEAYVCFLQQHRKWRYKEERKLAEHASAAAAANARVAAGGAQGSRASPPTPLQAAGVLEDAEDRVMPQPGSGSDAATTGEVLGSPTRVAEGGLESPPQPQQSQQPVQPSPQPVQPSPQQEQEQELGEGQRRDAEQRARGSPDGSKEEAGSAGDATGLPDGGTVPSPLRQAATFGCILPLGSTAPLPDSTVAADGTAPSAAAPVAPEPPPTVRSLCGAQVLVRGFDLACEPEHEKALGEEARRLRERLDGDVFQLLENWFNKAIERKNVRTACVVCAHLALLFQNVEPAALDTRACCWLLSAQVFLTHNFEWGAEVAPGQPASVAINRKPTGEATARQTAALEMRIAQTQLYDLWQRHRHSVWRSLRDKDQSAARSAVMGHVVRVVACTSPRFASPAEESEPWREMHGEHNSGRFVLDYTAEGRDRQLLLEQTESLAAGSSSISALPTETYESWLRRNCSIAPTQQEINLQLGEYHASIARKQLEVMHASFVDFEDFRAIFGENAKASSFQSAEVAATKQRTWLRLVHRRHELQRWAAPDASFTLDAGSFSNPYVSWMENLPVFLRSASGQARKAWLRELLEPVRQTYFPKLQLYLPPLGESFASAPAALLLGIAPDGVATREVVVLKSPPCVLVYNLYEHGRRWYRVLVFSSRADCSLAALPLATVQPIDAPVLACGDALKPIRAEESLVITRHVASSMVGLPPFLRRDSLALYGASSSTAAAREADKAAAWDYSFLSRRWQFSSPAPKGAEPAVLPLTTPRPPFPSLTAQSTLAAIEQTFVPSRLLRGLVPDALLETHMFWQNEDDSLTGYPIRTLAHEPAARPTMLLVTLEPLASPVEEHGSPVASEVASAIIRKRRLRQRQDAVNAERRIPEAYDATLTQDEQWEELPGHCSGQHDEILLNLLHPRAGGNVERLATLFRRLDDLSHVLAWVRMDEKRGTRVDEKKSSASPGPEWSLSRVELPRLHLTFEVRVGGSSGQPRLYCREHAHMFLSHAVGSPVGDHPLERASGCDEPEHNRAEVVCDLLQCLPHAVVLEDEQGDLAVLVSAAAKPWMGDPGSRTSGNCLLHRNDREWLGALTQARHYLYPVHPSHSVLCSKTIASSLYLLLMHFAYRKYGEVLRLADACMTDTRLSAEEEQLWRAVEEVGLFDDHPEADAARLKVWLVQRRSLSGRQLQQPPPSTVRSSTPVASSPQTSTPAVQPSPILIHATERPAPPLPLRLGRWDIASSLESYFLHRQMIRADCRLQPSDELALLQDHLEKLHAAPESRQPPGSEIGARLARYHDRLLEGHEASLAHGRQRCYSSVFETAAPGPSPLRSARWFDIDIFAPGLLDESGELEQGKGALRVVGNAQLAQGCFAGEAAMRQALDLLENLSLERHFVLLYELITGQKQLTLVPDHDKSTLMGAALLRALPQDDWANGAPLAALLELLVQQRSQLMEDVPRDQRGDGLAARLPHYDELKAQTANADPAKPIPGSEPPATLREVMKAGRVKIDPHAPPPAVDALPMAALFAKLEGDETARRLVRLICVALVDCKSSLNLPARSPNRDVAYADVVTTGSTLHSTLQGASRLSVRGLQRPLRPSDSSCPERRIRGPGAGRGELVRITLDEMDALAMQPLQQIQLTSFVVHVPSREASGLAEPPRRLSDIFDVDSHPSARTHVAKELIDRLDRDLQSYAAAYEKQTTPQLLSLQPEEISECVQKALIARKLGGGTSGLFASKLETALKRLSELDEKLRKMRDQDAATVAADIGRALGAANCEPAASSSRAELGFALRRLAGEEPHVDFPALAVQLLSINALTDLGHCNPHLGEERWAELLELVAIILMRTSRRAFLATAISMTRALRAELNELQEHGAQQDAAQANRFVLELQNKAAQLAALLCTKRNIARRSNEEQAACLSPARDTLLSPRALLSPFRSEESHVVSASAFVFDPRFLIFESISLMILRKEQVELVERFVRSLSIKEDGAPHALVSQLIMGAGKTTVILPLLALFLADGSQLIMQVVPGTLLTFTQSVLRERFSAFISKAIYTFSFDRSTFISPQLVEKLRDAEENGGLLCSTPSALKSFALAFLHLMHELDYMSRLNQQKPQESSSVLRALERGAASLLGRTASHGDSGKDRALRQQVQLCSDVLQIFKRGVLILDEVDLILHPLRSELNWPLGNRRPLDFTSEKHAIGLRWELPLHLLDALEFAAHGTCVMNVPRSKNSELLLQRIARAVERGCRSRAMTRQPHLQLLEKHFYLRELRPLLARWLLLFIVKLGVTLLDEEEMFAWIEKGKAPREVKTQALQRDVWQVKLLNLSHDLLASTLPFVLSKVNRVSYGLLSLEQIEHMQEELGAVPKSRRLLAVPFLGKDTPSLASEFSHPDVLISLTILAYSHEGLRDSDVRSALEALRDQMHHEFGPYHKRASSIAYVRWIEGAGARVRGMRQVASAQRLRLDDPVAAYDPSQPATPQRRAFASTPVPPPSSPMPTVETAKEVWPLHLIEWDTTAQMVVLFKMLRRQPEVVRFYLTNESPKEEPKGVFPKTLQFQNLKLCASGQEIGGDLLFGRRMGFSGTPNSLLPEELGKCSYTVGNDARMLHVLTSPSVVEATDLADDWSVRALLEQVAHWEPPLHALIDTGALVTGMSNHEVARYLLEAGLPHIQGCVFLDAAGCKMILMREGLQVLKLEQCGVPVSRRFSFYDQVHTTGIDIEQPASASAALTLGKDMTFRDYAQGAFRMRGIGCGQRIELLITPEVQQLIDDALMSLAPRDAGKPQPSLGPAGLELRKVVRWLHISTMRSESLQFHLLCDQSLANVWRKAAFGRMLQAHTDGGVEANCWSKELEHAIEVFRNPVAFEVSDEVPNASEREPLASGGVATESPIETVGGVVVNHAGRVHSVMERDGGVNLIKAFVSNASQVEVCNRITARLVEAEDVESPTMGRKGAADSSFAAMRSDAEKEEELEQQQECQQEEEREQEHQLVVVINELEDPPSVVLEDFAKLEFSRDIPPSHSWSVEVLGQPPSPEGEGCPFYPLSEFRLRTPTGQTQPFSPLAFPSYMLLSRNHFQPAWWKSSHRRLKNVIMVLDWVPALDAIAPRSPHATDRPISEEQEARLKAAWSLLAEGNSAKNISVDEFEGMLVAEGLDPERAAHAAMQHQDTDVSLDDARRALAQLLPFENQEGRYQIAVSLEEAEALRALLHRLRERRLPLLGGAASIALRHADQLFETSERHVSSDAHQLPLTARQCFRFFDSEVSFTAREVSVTLRALQSNPPDARISWFEAVRKCRRRDKRDWRGAPIERIFNTADQSQLMQEEAVRHKIIGFLRKNRIHAATFFAECDGNHDGFISDSELKNGLRQLEGLRMEPALFKVLVKRLDTDRDGSVSWLEWCGMFSEAMAEQAGLVREGDLAPFDESPEGEQLPLSVWQPRYVPDGAHERRSIEVAVGNKIPMMRQLKITVRMHPLGKALHCPWSTKGLPAQRKLSIWAPDIKSDFWSLTPNRQRFCVGYYGNSALEPPAERLGTLELEDVTQWQMVRGPWLDAALAQNAPHPVWFSLVWHKDSVERPIYAWRPEPPSTEFVALGMIFTTRDDPPPLTSMRCVHRSWVREATVEPECLWDDRGLGGRKGSVWRVNGMQLVWATRGYAPPDGPFYELIDTPFTLAEVHERKVSARPAPGFVPPVLDTTPTPPLPPEASTPAPADLFPTPHRPQTPEPECTLSKIANSDSEAAAAALREEEQA